MIKHLKEKQYYIDLYDRGTVERLRRWEKVCLADDGDKKEPLAFRQFLFDFSVNFRKGDEYERRAGTIRGWMEEDAARDAFVASARAPEGIHCLSCNARMKAGDGELCTWRGDRERALFVYACPNGHCPMRAFFANGEEYKHGEAVAHTEPIDCTVTKETVDVDFDKDRARFCMTEKEGLEYADSKYKMNHVTELFEKNREREKEKDVYDEAGKIRKLTVVDLEKLLIPILEKDSYVKFRFGEPDMGKDLFLPFTVHDAKPNRADTASTYDLRKLIGVALEDTNWGLIGDGASYRLGILTGRLRAYEREEDVADLVRRRRRSVSKASKV